MREDRERLAANIFWKKKRRVDREDKPNRQVMSEALDLYFGNEEGELDERIEEEKEELAEMQDTFQDLQEQMEEKMEAISELEAQKEEIEEEKQDYTDWLDELLNRRERGEGPFLVGDAIRADDKFSDYRKGAEKIQQDLKDRAREQKRKLCESDFKEGVGRGVNEDYLYEKAGEGTEGGEEAGEATNNGGANKKVAYGGGTTDD